MKAKMTVYQNGGKTPVATEPKKMMKTKSPLRMTKTKSPLRMTKTITPMPKPEKEVKLYKNGGKMPIVPDPKKKGMPDHFKTDAAKLSRTPSEVKVSQLKSQQGREMKDYKAAGRIGADQSGIFEGMKATNKKLSEMEAKAKKERAAKEKARASYMPKYSKGGMMKYLKGGQVKLDKNKDGKISGADFKMMK